MLHGFQVFSEITYKYDSVNGWLLNDVGFVPSVKYVNLEGTSWRGTFDDPNEGHITLEINEMAIGNSITNIPVKASAYFNNIINNYHDYSYTLTGFLNLRDLSIDLSFDKWIIERPQHRPGGTFVYVHDARRGLRGYLSAENSIIQGSRPNNSYTAFEVELMR